MFLSEIDKRRVRTSSIGNFLFTSDSWNSQGERVFCLVWSWPGVLIKVLLNISSQCKNVKWWWKKTNITQAGSFIKNACGIVKSTPKQAKKIEVQIEIYTSNCILLHLFYSRWHVEKYFNQQKNSFSRTLKNRWNHRARGNTKRVSERLLLEESNPSLVGFLYNLWITRLLASVGPHGHCRVRWNFNGQTDAGIHLHQSEHHYLVTWSN